jgi:cytochrome c-type biogenesis protein CcmE
MKNEKIYWLAIVIILWVVIVAICYKLYLAFFTHKETFEYFTASVVLVSYRVNKKKSINMITGMIQEETDEHIRLLLNNLQNGRELIINKKDIIEIKEPINVDK